VSGKIVAHGNKEKVEWPCEENDMSNIAGSTLLKVADQQYNLAIQWVAGGATSQKGKKCADSKKVKR
jgi:hypothetical protein